MDDPHILIAGAGIGGLAAALSLARKGWNITLCEREETLSEFGAGVQLSPNATRILASLGVLDALADYAVELEALTIRKAQTGEILTKAQLGETTTTRYGSPFLAVHRKDLQKALLTQVKLEPAILLETGLRLTDAQQDNTSVTATFTQPFGSETTRTADILIGADGLWSRAREFAGLTSPPRYSGNTAWRALIPRDQAPLFAREAEANLWLGKNAHLVHYPVCGGEEINIVAIIRDSWQEEGWSAPGNPDHLMREFSGWNHKVQDLLIAAKTWQKWALMDRAPENHWSSGRIAVMGDAAHPMVPFLAQGASQAIGDAAALANALSRPTLIQEKVESGLKTYEARRLGHTAHIQNAARKQAHIYHMQGIMAFVRDAALRAMPGSMLLTQYDWIYTQTEA